MNDVRAIDRLRLLRLSLTDESNKHLLSSVTKHNNDLGLLLGHRKRMAVLKMAKPSADTRMLSAFRENAISVFDLIQTDLASRCKCAGSHIIALRLEIMCDLEVGLDKRNAAIEENDTLETLFTFESESQAIRPTWCWRHVIFKPRAPAPANLSTLRPPLPSMHESHTTSGEERAPSPSYTSGGSLEISGTTPHSTERPSTRFRLR